MSNTIYSATSDNMKLVHWLLMGGPLHLVQRGRDWAEPQPAQAPPRCTKCNGPPINGQCTNHVLLYHIPVTSVSWYLFWSRWARCISSSRWCSASSRAALRSLICFISAASVYTATARLGYKKRRGGPKKVRPMYRVTKNMRPLFDCSLTF